MSEETRDEWARGEIEKFQHRLDVQTHTLANLVAIADSYGLRLASLEQRADGHEKRISDLEIARHNQPPN